MKRTKPAPIAVRSVGKPAAVSSFAALLLALSTRPRLKVVAPDEQPRGNLRPVKSRPV